jgi:hemolysin activation/secretion protein
MRTSTVLALVVPAFGAPALAQSNTPSNLTNNPALFRATDVDQLNDRFAQPELPLTSTDPEVPVLLDQTKPPANARAIRFAFRGFELEEARPIAQADLDEIAKPLSGQTVTLLQMFEAAAALAQQYEAQGYFRPRVSVPPQRITNGTVTLRVDEFAVDRAEITIDGQPAGANPVLDRIVADIKADRPLSHAVYQSARDRLARELGLAVVTLDSNLEPDQSITVKVGLSRRSPALIDQVGIDIPPSLADDKPPPGAEHIRFRLDRMEISGSSAYSADQLAPAYSGLIGQEISVADLYAITAKLRGQYAADGYVPPEVVVPGQSIVGGSVRLEINEVWASRVVVLLDGVEVPPGDLLYRTANRVANVQPLTIAVLNRYALLLADIPGIRIRSITQPKEPGGIATVELARKTFSGSVGIDNRGSQPTGIIQGMASVAEAGVLGFNERLTASHITMIDPEEVRILGLGYDQPLTSDGLKLSTFFSRTLGNPGANLKPEQAQSFGSLFTAGLSYPIIRSSIKNLSVTAQFDYLNSLAQATPLYDPFFGGQTFILSNDRTRRLRFGARYDFIDSLHGLTAFSVRFSQGLDIFGSRETGSEYSTRVNGVSDYQKFNAELTRTQPLGATGLALVVGVTGQYALDRLLGPEQFSVGGKEYGRGYNNTIIMGDHGFATKTELQYSGAVGLPYFQGYQLFTGYDFGRTWKRDRIPGEKPMDDAASMVAGARLLLTEWLSGELVFAQPLTRAYYTSGNVLTKRPQYFFGLQASF